jgi:toxin secretion/phage lysis holin
MEKIFNDTSIIIGLLGGLLSFIFGGLDVLIYALLGLSVIDFITGLIKAIYTKTLSSEICFKGLLKKITIYLVVATAVIVNNVIGGNIPLREVVITFFICNEGLSLLENVAVMTPVPEQLKNVLLQLRDRNGSDTDGTGK